MNMKLPHKITRKFWIPLLAIVIGVPLFFWSMSISVTGQLSAYTIMTLLGQATGIVGAQLFALTLILGARLRFMEFFFGGLDRMYVIHHRIGVIAFSLLAVHPLILAFRFVGDSLEDVMDFLIPINNTVSKDFGIYSLLGMLLLIGLTFYGSFFNYPKLKFAHKFLGAAFFLGFLHMFFVPGAMQMVVIGNDYSMALADEVLSKNTVLKLFCLSVSLFGIAAFSYRTLFGKYLVKRFDYSVSEVKMIGQSIVEITLSPLKKAMVHLPGQFAMLSFVNAKGLSQEEHPFTISSASSAFPNGEIRFSIKALGDYTSLLPSITTGVKAKLEGPFGEFTYSYGSQKQIWVAGGIGVTPFVSMAEDLLTQDTMEHVVDFFYSVRSDADGAYKEIFTKLAAKHKNFVFHYMPSDKAGYVTGELIMKEISDAKKRDFFVCGPPPMMAALTDQLIALTIQEKQIHSEKFALLK